MNEGEDFRMDGKIRKRAIMLLLIAMTVLAAACSKKEAADQSPSASGSVAPSASSVAESPTAGEEADPFGKYDPPITLSTVKILCDCSKFAPGETADKNIWIDGYLKDLGIDMKVKWSVVGNQPGGAGEQKLNVSIASGDLPDIIPVGAKQLKQLVDAGLAEDLSGLLEKYGSPQLKKFMNDNGGLALKTATFDGKLLALPDPAASIDVAALIWVRKDWLDKLGLPEPKTMADVLSIADAFTNKDPDGNGKKDTFGLGLTKDLYGTGLYDLIGFFEGYHAYNTWIQDESGKLVHGATQPNMKTALGKLQEMFKAGQIDPEFGVKDNTKVNESVVSGKIGMEFGAHWNAFYPFPDAYKQDPAADWRPYPIVSADANPAVPSVGLGINKEQIDQAYFVFKKGSPHPEALIKLANYYVDKEYGFETGGYDTQFHQPTDKDGNNPDGYSRWPLAAVIVADPNQNINIYRGVKAIMENNDQNAMKNDSAVGNYKLVADFMATKNPASYANALWAAPENSGLSILQYYLDNNLTTSNQFYGSDTPTMVQKKATLEKLQLERFTKIIMGGSLDMFDQFVSDWKKLGGDAITQEVNDWLAAQH